MENNKPDKLPDFIIIKEQGIEIGKLKAYIEELEYKVSREGIQALRDAKKSIKHEQIYQQQQKEIKELKKEVTSLRNNLSDMAGKLITLQSSVHV